MVAFRVQLVLAPWPAMSLVLGSMWGWSCKKMQRQKFKIRQQL